MSHIKQESTITISIIIFIFITIIGVFFLPESGENSSVKISIDGITQDVLVGQNFSVNITIDPANNNITAAQFNLIYNSSYLEVLNVTEGNLLKHDGANTIFNIGTLNNTRGTLLNVWGLIITPGAKVKVKDTMATITMHAKASGYSQINFTNVIVSYPDSQAAQVNVTNSSVLVVNNSENANVDLNNDGMVTKLDIDIIRDYFGNITSQPYPKFDVNSDGKVNVLDATVVSKQI